MARTYARQPFVRKSDAYDDDVAAGVAMQNAAVDLEDDLNNIRSQLKRALGTTNWYDALAGRSLADVDSDLSTLEQATRLFRAQVLADVVVPAAQNWVVLSVAGSQAPSEVAAVGAVTSEGAVVAVHGGAFGSHSLAEVAGVNGINPKNLVEIRDGTTGDFLLTSTGKKVYGLLQSESATNGAAFNDTTNQVQISFVIENGTADDLIACPVGDIANKTVNYSYVRRLQNVNIPEQAFLSGVFIDHAASVDVTLNNAIDNQAGAASQGQNIDIDMAAGVSWEWRDATAARLFGVTEGSGGGASAVQLGDAVDLFDVDAVVNDFKAGITVGSGGGNALDLFVAAGQIAAEAALTLASGGAGDLTLNAAGELLLVDGNKAGSGFAGNLKLADTSAEWDAYESNFGEASLLNALVQARGGRRSKATAVVTAATVAANANVTGAGGTPNLDAQLPAYLSADFVDHVNVYLNGSLMRPGADASANNDVYPGTTPANGDLKFEFDLKQNDVLTVEVYG